MASGQHIFLSYRSIEADFALKIAADLKNAGVKIWMDRLDGIQIGTNWIQAISEALDDASCIVVIISPDYIASTYNMGELSRAVYLNIPIIPLLIRQIASEQLPDEIKKLRMIDFTSHLDSQEYNIRLDELVQKIRDISPILIGDKPSPERIYLQSLIAELESYQGVLDGYSELNVQVVSSDVDGIVPDLMPSEKEGIEELYPAQLVLERLSRVLLLGSAGAGKTTVIRRFVLGIARKRLNDPKNAPIPLLLYLPRWHDEPTPLDFIRTNWKLNDPLDELLNSGEVLLCLDGLNEIGENTAEKVTMLRNWLTSEVSPQKIIITCRIPQDDEQLDIGLTKLFLRGLSQQQIENFVTNHLAGNAVDFLDQLSVILNDFSLLTNPYFLTALTLFYEYNSFSIPKNPGVLFSRLTRAIWERERLRQSTGWIPYEDFISSTSQLAYDMIYEGLGHSVPIKYALRRLTSPLYDLLVSIDFLMEDKDQVKFSHISLQYFFAALSLIPKELSNILSYPQFTDAGRIPSEWDSIILSMCGVSDDPDKLIKMILEIDPFLAGQCAATGVALSKEILSDILERLKSIAKKEGFSEGERKSALDTLSNIQNLALLPFLTDIIESDSMVLRRDAVQVAFRIIAFSTVNIVGKEEFIKLLVNTIKVEDLCENLRSGPIIQPTQNTKYVFVSYSRKDSDFMENLKDNFIGKNINIWVDVLGLKPGTFDWQSKIAEAIKNSICVLVLLSPDACQSEWVLREIEFARIHEKSIIPVVVRGEPKVSVPFVLINAQWIYVTELSFQEALEEIFLGLQKILDDIE